MNTTETKRKEPYEPPELLDIKPVTFITGISNESPLPDSDDEE